ncbi:hypothetical protein Zmor_023821 [Zophobas morio]|uniref:Tyr recombinase domain-containing protein n=1 Tax=Zophobas morio TaxID=2755281 RepID=A0AA38I0L0_9CUCU|nr:hypothetical protein Zmor_023821 [Zophobas morio]
MANMPLEETLNRWMKEVPKEAGVDVDIFTAHSTRRASTPAGLRKGISIEEIQRTVSWSASTATFAKLYNRAITIRKFANYIKHYSSSQDVD